MTTSYALKLIVLFLILPVITLAQCPTSGFDSPSSACLQENIDLKNNSTEASKYEWLFCTSQYSASPAFNKLVTGFNGVNISSVYYSKFIELNDDIFLYFISNATNKLYGVRITNPNTLAFQEYTEIDISSIVTGAAGFDVINENGTWVGLISKISSPYGIIRITLTNDLKTISSSTNLSTGLTLSSPFDVKILNDDGNYFAFVANQTALAGQQILKLSFGSSLLNLPTASYFSMPAGTQSASFDFYQSCNSWTGFVSSRNGKIFRFDFGGNLSNPPATTELSLGSALNDPGGLAVVSRHDEFILLSQSRNGFFYSIDLGTNITNNAPTVTSIGNFKGTSRDWDLEVLRHNGSYIIASSNFTTGSGGGIYSLSFSQTCPASVEFSVQEEEHITFSQPGTHKITLIASNSAGRESFYTRHVMVSNSYSPLLTINSENTRCLNSPASLTFSSDLMISTQLWDFGDAQTSSDASPSHSYSAPGNYSIGIEAVATNGCRNVVSRPIEIFNPPQPLFDMPDADLICTNNEFTFVNRTVDSFAGSLSFNWSVNSFVSADRDLKYTFTSPGNHQVKLEVSIPGCSNELTQTVNDVQTGPTVGFTSVGQCEDKTITFTNISTGDINGYAWDFDNGITSSETNPVIAYESPGKYSVSLKTTGTNGCVSTTSNVLPIYTKPQPNFQLELPPFSCSGMPSQFTDLTPNPTDSNITSWAWDFGDSDDQSGSPSKNPTHIYSLAGQYDVKLITETNFGCKDSLSKVVTIVQTPEVSITNTPSCEDVPITFSTSAQNDIASWNWQIGNAQFTIPEPTYVFNNPGNYTASLNAVGKNNCIASANKTVVVPLSLVPNFTVDKNCIGQPTLFTDVTAVYDDPIKSYEWNFGDTGSGTNSPEIHTYTNTGSYNVNLKTTTESGCVYSNLKTISVGNPPQALFTATPEVGVPPLTVSFLNQSVSATQYQWNFNDINNSTSTAVSPQFTFQDYGDYIVDLTAFNAQNCSHTFSKIIKAQLPLVDVGLENFTISENADGLLIGQVVIHNKGNFTLQNLELTTDLSGIIIHQTVSTPIAPFSSILYPLDFKVSKSSLLKYVCLEAKLTGDINMEDNSICTSIESDVVVFSPYPNPSSGQINVKWIAPSETPANLIVIDPLGKMVFESEVMSSKGGNEALLHLEGLSQGMYYLLFHTGQTKQAKPFVITR